MKRSTKVWLWVTALFVIVNVAGGAYAAVLGEGNHAGVHVVLSALGLYVVWRLSQRTNQPDAADAPLVDQRLEQLQQSVDAVAIEVERIGEQQRYQTKIAAERVEPKR